MPTYEIDLENVTRTCITMRIEADNESEAISFAKENYDNDKYIESVDEWEEEEVTRVEEIEDDV